MTKKDTIILAVLFNLVVLAGVLATAHQLTPTPESRLNPCSSQSAREDKEVVDRAAPVEDGAMVFDEIDQLLEDYIADEPAVCAEPAKPKKVAKVEPVVKKAQPPADAYYTIQAGDNPWKIAKKFHLSREKLLQLNHLDDAKARNLKVGQKLKIREAP